MLTGSLYVADSLESGVAISGYKNSGFVRSLGYQGFDAGFPGFLLWSGSALTGSLTKYGNLYSGVGLELYLNTASYFRYSTSDNEIYVATDNFFFGNPATAYISGSNGLIEISSSNFVLNSNGSVTASAFIAINNGTTMLDTNSGYADGKNIGRHIGHQYGTTNTVSSTTLTQIGNEYVIYIKDGEDIINTFGHFIITSLSGTTTFELIIGISNANGSTFNTWDTEETSSLFTLSAPIVAPVEGTFKESTNIPNSFITDFRRKLVRIRLLAKRTTPANAGQFTLANVSLETGRPLGGSTS
jgi:hypothetical protein